MSVYTQLTHQEISHILTDYNLGSLHGFQGIEAGIENSNFFIDTASGRHVLTVFERLPMQDAPYFMEVMRHLSKQGLPCPNVHLRADGGFFFNYKKYGCIISCLSGETQTRLSRIQLAAAGNVLGRLHRYGSDFKQQRINSSGLDWMCITAESLADRAAAHYGEATKTLLLNELAWQKAQQKLVNSLPTGLIHADYFCDNMLFEGDALVGVIDFYYACNDAWLYDLAIATNALALDIDKPSLDRAHALLAGYVLERPLQENEKQAMQIMLRLSALRFWVSRLFDALYPRQGSMITIKDPEEYHQKLLFWQQVKLF
ncbi:MAG: homoserine kinase [Mariprofundales bacterium]